MKRTKLQTHRKGKKAGGGAGSLSAREPRRGRKARRKGRSR